MKGGLEAMGGSRNGRRRLLSLLPLLCMWGMILLAHPGRASAQPGFVTVDCGAVKGYVDTTTGILYEADNYIGTGVIANTVATDSTQLYLNTLRYFPAATTPRKNCYEVPVTANTQYLVRAFFYHGGYTTPAGTITFQLAVDSSVWVDEEIDSTQNSYTVEESIVMSRGASLSVCLIRTGDGSSNVPFINSLEIRPLPSASYLGRYPTPSAYLLNLLRRGDLGESTKETRYPADQYDRIWYPLNATVFGLPYTDISAPAGQTFNLVDGVTYDNPPNVVLQTAITDPTLLNITGYGNATLHPRLYVTFYFAEVLAAGGTRIMDISGDFISPSFTLEFSGYPFYVVELTRAFPIGDGYITLLVAKNTTSTLGPLCNGLEIYALQDTKPGTDATEATILATVKANLSREVWSGDPCIPVPWFGLNCTDNQVTSIDLSSQDLTGDIPDFSGLTTLTSLNLSNNGFTGLLPTWVAGLTSLTTLDVSNNQLSGTFPASYINNIPGFRYANNLQLTCVPADGVVCPPSPPAQPLPPSTPRGSPSQPPPGPASSGSTKKKSSNPVPIIGAVVGVVLVLAAIIGAVLLYCCCYKKRAAKVNIPKAQSPLMNLSLAAPSTEGTPLHVAAMRGKAQPFTLLTIKEATNNFARKIGEGGFGPVYVGMLKPQQEVAVKVMSGKTQQGFSEFSNEIDLLSTVHYKRLVSLVGYCQEGSDLILLYEYMSGGDLRQRLYGPNASHVPLNWRQRLHIALDAARGLEYLHHGCNPAIFHRDVKSSNILLTEKLEAKVADFGLSRLTDLEQTHVMTMVKGTVGYLDPEYNTTGMLTDKSDVYSFGIVLLELLSGQPPIAGDGPYKFIVDKVRAAMNTGSLVAVTDPRLRGDYKPESVWKLAEVALSCVPISAASRPGMTKVVAELAKVLEIEFGGQQNAKWENSSGSDLFASNTSASNYTNNYSNNYSNAGSLPEEPSQIFHQDVRPSAR